MDKLSDKDLTCVYETEKRDCLVRLLEYTKPCGHPGYLIEVFLTGKEKPMQAGCFGWEGSLLAIQLMLDAAHMASDLTGRWIEKNC